MKTAELPWDAWILAVMVVGAWALSWWCGTRRFRLWFALLAPFGAVVGLVAGLVSMVSGCTSACAGNTQNRVGNADAVTGSAAGLVINFWVALPVTVALTLTTLVVEYILLVRRTR
jgi:hypothetical protein